MKCPICKKDVNPEGPDFPFCSERCRTVDLGNWAAEKYRIPAGPNQQAENDEDEKR
jgi:uncharacterized protein